MIFKIGDRVRMVQTESYGVIAGEVEASPVDGGPRQPVRWDRTGITNAWNPAFLRPADTKASDDPDEVSDGSTVRRRGKATVDLKTGVSIIVPEGFSRRSS